MRSATSHRTRLLVLLASAALPLAACGDGNGTEYGPAQLRVVSGMDQPTTAVRDSLDVAIAVQLFRAPQSPGVALRMVPRLHAQQALRGLAGQTVAAEGVGDNPLQPWNATATTDEDGVARFQFNPGTTAGESCAELRATVDGIEVVPDTVCVAVGPGPVAAWTVTTGAAFFVGGTLDLKTLVRGAVDVHGNAVAAPPLGITLQSGTQASLAGTTLSASVETGASAWLKSGGLEEIVQVWAVRDLRPDRWRLEWECYGARLPGGAVADSTHHVMEVDSVRYGPVRFGFTLSIHGAQRDTVWNAHGAAASVRPQAVRSGDQSSAGILWEGQNVTLLATPVQGVGYVGGIFCEGTPGVDFARVGYVRLRRL